MQRETEFQTFIKTKPTMDTVTIFWLSLLRYYFHYTKNELKTKRKQHHGFSSPSGEIVDINRIMKSDTIERENEYCEPGVRTN